MVCFVQLRGGKRYFYIYIYAVTFFWVLLGVVLIYRGSVFSMVIYWPPFLDPLFPGQMCNRCVGWVTRVPLLVKNQKPPVLPVNLVTSLGGIVAPL